MTLTAHLVNPDKPPHNAYNHDSDKERISRRLVLAVPYDPAEEPRTLIDLRLWMSRTADGAGPVYAAVWIRPIGAPDHPSGRGKASGYGYCKQSAAAVDALQSAGVLIVDDNGKPQHPHGSGMSVVDELLLSLGKSLLAGASHRLVLVD